MKYARTIPARFALAAFLLAAAAAPTRAEDAYIESDGTQFMNTGYYVGSQTKIEFDYAIANWAETSDYFQMRLLDNNAGNKGGMQATVYVAGSTAENYSLGIAMGDRTAGQSLSGVWTKSECTSGTMAKYCDSNRRMITIDEPNKLMSISENGTVVWTSQRTTAATMTAIWPLGIFGRPTSALGQACDYPARIRVYGLKIYEAGELVRDFSPVVKGGIAGLLDSKTGIFLYDTRYSGYGTFATGGDIPTIDDDPYVESDGTSAINLGVSASPKLKIALDYALLEGNDLQDRLFGQDTVSSTPRFSAYINGSQNIALAGGTDTAFNNVSTGCATNTARHTVVIDNVALRNAYMTGVTTNWYGYGSTKADCTKCATRPLALFGNTNADDGSAFTQCTKMKVYGLRIWAGGTLIRDLAPRNINGTAGFEDLVTGRFYTCAGLTASANAPTSLTGASREGDAFIESDGSFFSVVNTYYFVKPTTKIEIDYALASIVSSAGVLGGYGADAGISTILWCKNTSNFVLEMRDGNHDSTVDKLSSSAIPLDLARHTAVFDGPGRHLSLSSPDGTIEAESAFPESWTLNATKANWPVLLFGFATDEYGHNKQRSKARIYGVKFYENGSPVLTLTPAVKGGVAGFKDGDGNFYSGDGLIAGGAVETLDEDPYVENPDGGRYFDTGYYVTSNTCIKIDYMPLVQQTSQQFPFEGGSGASATTMFMRIYGNGSAGQGDVSYACGQSGWSSLNVPYAPHVRRKVTIDAYNLATKIETAGQTIRETTITASGRAPEKSNNTLKLLSNSTMNGNSCKARLYGVQIFEEGTLVRDYVPICQGGSYALLDKVQGKVLTKASTKEFTGFTANNALNDSFFNAEMRAEDAYIESDGTQGIDMGYFTTPQTRYEIDYQMTAIRGQNRPFGAAAGNLSAELYIQGEVVGSGNVAFGVGNSWKGQYTNMGADLDRHVAFLDLANRECGYSGKGMIAFSSDTVCNRNSSLVMSLFTKGEGATFGGGEEKNRTAMKLYAFRIYESGVLVHEWLPYKVGNVVGIYDTMTGAVKTNDISGGNAFTYGGGLGYGKFAGDLTDLVVEPADTQVGVNSTKTLSAYAPGATSYVWTRNGETLAGTTGTECIVAWEKPSSAGTLVYAVTPVFTKGGETVYGASAEAEVTMAPASFLMVVR